MRITKRQLKRMIAEAMPRGGAPDVVGATTGVPGGNIQNLVDEYKEWAIDYMGSPSGANSSSVLATFLVDRGLDQGAMAEDIMKDISREMKFDIVDVRRAVKVAREEHDAGGTLSDEEIHQRGFKEGHTVRVNKRRFQKILKEEVVRALNEYGNPPPPRDSNWSEFAMAIDVGVLDLDEIAYDLGFRDFADMDISISPKSLADRDATTFITAVRNFSMAGSDMSDEDILIAAGSSAPSQTHSRSY